MSPFSHAESGGYDAVYERMLQELPGMAVETERGVAYPLANLNLAAQKDFALVLLSAWATVADIVGFYHERIAEEGYLPTANEPLSIRYLGNLIGYRGWRGAASSTWLALTVSSTSLPQASAGTGIVTIPEGGNLVVTNIPPAGSMPVVFESHDAIEARVEWNNLKPAIPVVIDTPVVFQGMIGVRLAGAVTSIRSGSPLLIRTAKRDYFRLLDAVEVLRPAGYTVATWTEPLTLSAIGPGTESAPPANPPEPIEAIYTFRQQAGLFGRRALAWPSAPDRVRSLTGTRRGGVMTLTPESSAWTSIQRKLPADPVRALVIDTEGNLFAGTSGGLYTSVIPPVSKTIAVQSWSQLSTSPSQLDVHSLLLDSRGFLYVGGARGAVSFSTDSGQSWQTLRFPPVNGDGATAPDGISWWRCLLQWLHIIKPPPPPAPTLDSASQAQPATFDGVVRALARGLFGDEKYLFLGTDRGVCRLQEGGLEWQTFSKNLPGYNGDTGLCGTIVHALYLQASTETSPTLFAGTDSGIYSCSVAADGWQLQRTPLTVQPAVFAFAESGGNLFAGSAAGLFSKSASGSWEKSGLGLPANCEVRSLAVSAENGRQLLAGTNTGAYQSTDGGNSWKAINDQDDPDRAGAVIPLSSLDIQAVALGGDGRGFLAAPPGDFLEKEWPGFQLSGDTVVLDRVISGLQTGSCAVLQQDEPNATAVVATVEHVEQRAVQVFGRQGTVSMLTLSATNASLEPLRQRDTNIYCQPVALEPYVAEKTATQLLGGSSVDVDGVIETLNSGQPLAITGLNPTAILPSVGGVFQVTGACSKKPEGIRMGLRQESVLALTGGGGFYWAVVEGAGVYARAVLDQPAGISGTPAGSSRWMRLTGGVLPAAPICLAWTTDGLWAATREQRASVWDQAKGVWREDAGSPQSITALAVDPAGTIYAAGDPPPSLNRSNGADLAGERATAQQCVFRKLRAASAWEPLSLQMSLSEVSAFAFNDEGAVCLGAAQGVFVLNPQSKLVGVCEAGQITKPDTPARMAPPNAVLPDVRFVTALGFDRGSLYAGTRDGHVFQLGAEGWKALTMKSLEHPVRSFAFPGDGALLAGTAGAGIHRFCADDGSWESVFPSASNDVTALLLAAANTVLVATRNSAVLGGEGADLKRADRRPLFTAPVPIAGLLDLETVSADLTALFQQNGIVLRAPAVSVQVRGELWILRSAGGIFVLYLRDPGQATAVLCVAQTETLFALARESARPALGSASDPTANAGGKPLWRWTLGDGTHKGSIVLPEDDLLPGPSLPGSATVGEVTKIAAIKVSLSGDSTCLRFDPPLENLYDPGATSMTANLAFATQGVTVPVEILGSGNAAVAGQSFALKRPPLTYTSDRSDGRVTGTLEVRVNSSSAPSQLAPSMVNPTPVKQQPDGEVWSPVHTLYGALPEAHVYSLPLDAQGNEVVQFGDGVQGARLPTGTENVSARYRSGLGTQGNVAAGTLIVFRKRPLGIRAVTNPVPAIGGSDAETLAESETRMALSTRALDRVVSLQDYTDFCLTWPGVQKIKVTLVLVEQRSPCICVTVRWLGNPPPAQIKLKAADLAKAVHKARGSCANFEIDEFAMCFFRLEVEVSLAPTDDPEAVREAVRDALWDKFSPDRRSFAQPATSTEVVAVAQGVAGVAGITLKALYSQGSLPTNEQSIPALPARWDADKGKVLPAQLLVIDPGFDGVLLALEDLL